MLGVSYIIPIVVLSMNHPFTMCQSNYYLNLFKEIDDLSSEILPSFPFHTENSVDCFKKCRELQLQGHMCMGYAYNKTDLGKYNTPCILIKKSENIFYTNYSQNIAADILFLLIGYEKKYESCESIFNSGLVVIPGDYLIFQTMPKGCPVYCTKNSSIGK